MTRDRCAGCTGGCRECRPEGTIFEATARPRLGYCFFCGALVYGGDDGPICSNGCLPGDKGSRWFTEPREKPAPLADTQQPLGIGPTEGAGLIEALLPDDVLEPDSPVETDDEDTEDSDKGAADDDEEEQDEEQDEDSDEEDTADSDEEEGEEEDGDEDANEDHFVIEVDGKEVKVTEDELLKGYLRQSDYTKKTQALAEGRKEVDAVRDEAAQARAQYAEKLKLVETVLEQADGPEPDWEKLRREDPSKYAAEYTDWQRRQAQKKALKDEQERVQAETQQEYESRLQGHLEQEAGRLKQALPDMGDPAKAKALQTALVDYGVSVGFAKEELQSIIDHRALVILNKARLYDELQAGKPRIKAKVKKGKIIKPGTTRQGKSKRRVSEKALKAVQKSGSKHDAARAIHDMLPDDVL
jgi:hypothetical protein